MTADALTAALREKLPATPELLDVARRVVWFKAPEEALADPIHFLAHLMTYTTLDDLLTVRKYVTVADLRQVLAHAPAGVFDGPSWSYWNLVTGRDPAAEMPTRMLPREAPRLKEKGPARGRPNRG